MSTAAADSIAGVVIRDDFVDIIRTAAGPSEMHSDRTYLSSQKRRLPAGNKPEPRSRRGSSVRICGLVVALHAAATPHARRN